MIRALVFTIILSITAVVTLTFGFKEIDTPVVARDKLLDQQRIMDISNLKLDIEDFNYQNYRLPSSLSEVKPRLYTTTTKREDPATQQPYEYQKVSDTGYKLCAMFDRDADASKPNLGYSSFEDKHTKGNYCFDFTVKPTGGYYPLPTPRPLPILPVSSPTTVPANPPAF